MLRLILILVFGLANFLVTIRGLYWGRQVSRCGDIAPEGEECWCGSQQINTLTEQCCSTSGCVYISLQAKDGQLPRFYGGNCTSGNVLPLDVPCDGICWNTKDNHGVSTVCQANGGKCAESTMPINFMCRGVILGICKG